MCYNSCMPKQRSWTDDQLIDAVQRSRSIRNVLILLGLIPAGGNYVQVKSAIERLTLDTTHFTGKGWNVGLKFVPKQSVPLETLLTKSSGVQSYKLKKRLYASGLKQPKCELCCWAKMSIDGRRPLELAHINGDHSDNRIENLRILCPNCHSLQPTHRGLNKKVAHARVVE